MVASSKRGLSKTQQKTSTSSASTACHMGPLPLVLKWVCCWLLGANQMTLRRIRNVFRWPRQMGPYIKVREE